MTLFETFSLKLLFIALIFLIQSTALKIQTTQNLHSHRSASSQNLLQNKLQHSQSVSPVYDEQRYLIDLAQKQNAFKQKIIEIQNGFAGINIMLNDSSLSQSEKTMKLNQALADERDILITVQKQLNLPYELKSCECLNLTEQKKRDLSAQLQKIKIKISQLEQSSIESNKHCQSHNCPLINELNDQIQMMKSYQTIMENTINSKCCETMKYQYRDNLDANSWHWGNNTQSNYQAWIYKKQEENNMKMQPCPYNLPWVQLENNTCFACPTQKPLFNLGTRLCEKDCTQFSGNSAYLLNLTTHVCGYNVNCPSGQYFDETLKKCSTQPTNTNESSCPPSRPFWDPLSYSCQSCPVQNPYFDVTMKKCRKCLQNERWNQNSRRCESFHNCEDDYYFDQQSKKCVKKSNNTHSLCPPERPFWNEQTYSCDECGNQKPIYDPVKKICRTCTEKQNFNQFTKTCSPKAENITCAENEIYNNQTKQCEKRGTTSMCPPSTPYWDSVNFKCMQCPSDKPSFNEITRLCEVCPLNYEWSATYQQCIPNCAFDQKWNQQYKRCLRINQTCPQKYTFNFYMNQCVQINCDQKNPFWNSTLNKCQPCPVGTVYNYVTRICEKDSRSGNISVCYQDKPVWNPEYMRCEPCPKGKVWNFQAKACLDPSINEKKQNHFSEIQPSFEPSHHIQHIQGQVYGNDKIMYQHRDLSYLHQ